MSEEIRKVQHYHTKTANAKPSATNMLDGEIAVNMTADNEKLFIKNTDNEIVEFLPADKLATKTELSGKMDKVTLATVATSGNYNDLSNKPTIPTKLTDLEGGENLLETTELKTVNGENIVKGTDDVTDIKTQLAYAEYTGTATAAVVTTKYGYFPTTLVEGASVAVKFEGSLTYITTLDVNGTGAKNVYYKGNSLSSGTINRYNTYLFVYDGSYYRIVGIDTDTHYTAKNVVTSSSTSKSNATATNGNVRLNLIENSAVRSTHKIVGTGATTVTSDSSGNITIDTPLKTINGESIVGSGDITIEGGGGGNVYTWSVPVDVTTGTVTPEEYAAIKEASQVYIEKDSVSYQAAKIDVGTQGMVALSVIMGMGDDSGNSLIYGLYFEIDPSFSFSSNTFIMSNPTKTSQLINDSNFVTYAEFEWDGSSDEGTVTQEKFEELRNANTVIVKQQDGDVIAHACKTSGGAVLFYYSTTMNNIISSAMFIVMDHDYSWTCSTSQTTIPAAVTEATVSGWGFTKNTGTYSKPTGGIPKSDLTSAVQTSLEKADTALQSYTEQYKGTVTGVKINGTTKNPTSGIVDLGTVITDSSIFATKGEVDLLIDNSEQDIKDYVETELNSQLGHYAAKTDMAFADNKLQQQIDNLPIPKYTSELINDSDFINSDYLKDYVTTAQLDDKQDTLVSGTNIKTINGTSILGSGNIEISGGSGSSEANVKAVDIDENLDDVEEIDSNVKPYILTTYAELCNLRNNSALIPGVWYRITDYVTTTSQDYTASAGHPFDVLVFATTNNTLSEEAKAVQCEGDSYFNTSNLDAWKILYCLDNDTNRFMWASITNGKGVIYQMIDEYGNECPYDFKNIQFLRGLYFDHEGLALSPIPNGDEDFTKYCYTFSWEDSNGKILDISIFGNNGHLCNDDGEIMGTHNNIIKSCKYGNIQDLNNNVFLASTNDEGFFRGCYFNVFGYNCYNNTFNGYSVRNKFGDGCHDNSFGVDSYNNTFGNSVYNNKFGRYNTDNIFGNGCYVNNFGDDCCHNHMGDECCNNSFGDSCSNNRMGDECYSNLLIVDCSENTFGNKCKYIECRLNYTNNCNFADNCSYAHIYKPNIGPSVVNITSCLGSSSHVSIFEIDPVMANSGNVINCFRHNNGDKHYDYIMLEGSNIVEVLYRVLTTHLVDNSLLIPGLQYRIIDYVTTTSQENTISAGHKFDVIVTAIDSSTLSEDAKATWNASDSYFNNSDLNSWEIKYTLNHTDEDTKFAWGGNTSEELHTTEGYTYDSSACTIKPELINDRSFITPLRFESCLWSDTADSFTGSYVDGDSNHDEGEPIYEWDYYYDSNGAGHLCLYKSDEGMYEEEGQPDYGDKYLYRGVTTIDGTEYDYWQKIEERGDGNSMYIYGNATVFATTARIVANPEDCIITHTNIVASTRVQVAPKGVIYYMKDEFGNECPYDFKNIMFIRYKLNSPEDTPVHNAIVDKKFEIIRYNFDCEALPYIWGGIERNTNKIWDAGEDGLIISKPTGEYEAFYTFTLVYDDGTFGDATTLSRHCGRNIINKGGNKDADSCGYTNEVLNGNIFFVMDYDMPCENNTLGYDCFCNTFGLNAGDNLLSNNSMFNVFGDWCLQNKLGNYTNDNYFSDYCYGNNFYDFCSYNLFGSNCGNNLLQSDCSCNIFDAYVSYNTLKHYSSSNALGNSSCYNTFGEESTKNLFTAHASLESSLITCNNVHIGAHCHNNIIFSTEYDEENPVPIKNINIKSGVSGSYVEYNHICVDIDCEYETIIAKNSKGEIKVYCEADLIG